MSSLRLALLASILGYTSISLATPLLTNLGSNCNLSNVSIEAITTAGLPPPPANSKLVSVVLGYGTQNYTCNDSGTYTSIGSVAKLVDASCALSFIASFLSPEFNITTVYDSTTPVEVKLNELKSFPFSGDYYLVANASGTPPNTISPLFDFRSGAAKGDPEGFVIMNKSDSVPSPVDPANNIDWIHLTAIPCDGQFASTAYRFLTLGGQPPASCTKGSTPLTITVPYAANYWFYK